MAPYTKQHAALSKVNALKKPGMRILTPPNLITVDRAPTQNDYQNFQIGALWIDRTSLPNPSTYILVKKANQVATWVIFAAAAGDVAGLRADDANIAYPLGQIIDVAGGTLLTTTAAIANTLTINITDGNTDQVIIGGGGAGAAWGELTSTGGTVAIAAGGVPYTINLEAVGVAGLVQLGSDTGIATPVAGQINVLGGTLIDTDAPVPGVEDITVNITNGTDGQVIIGGGANAAWSTITAGPVIDITNAANAVTVGITDGTTSQVIIGGGGAGPDWGTLTSTGGTIAIAAGGVPYTINLETALGAAIETLTGDVGGAITGDGVNNVNILGTGITTTGAVNTMTVALDIPVAATDGGTGIVSPMDHSVLIGSAALPLTELGVATDGQLIIGSTGVDPVLANLLSSDGSVTITNTAGGIDLVATAGGGAGVVMTDFTTNGTWTKNAATTSVTIILWDGGAGGGSGRQGSSGSSSGGNGGTCSSGTIQVLPASIFAATETVVVGAGGAGGAAQASSNSDGNVGVAGTKSYFGNIAAIGGNGGSISTRQENVASYGGFGGLDGTPSHPQTQNTHTYFTHFTMSSLRGTFLPVATTPTQRAFWDDRDRLSRGGWGNKNNAPSAYSLVNIDMVGASLNCTHGQSGGGGGGASSSTVYSGAAGIDVRTYGVYGEILVAGGLAGVSTGVVDGGNGVDGLITGGVICGGAGGGGGGGQTGGGGTPGNGGNGGFPGGGGGGGGGSLNATVSGAGGDGGAGRVLIIETW